MSREVRVLGSGARALLALALATALPMCNDRDRAQPSGRSWQAPPGAGIAAERRPEEFKGPKQGDEGVSDTSLDDQRKRITATKEAVNEAVAELKPAEGSKVKGKVKFERAPGGVKIVADVEGLKPGQHALRVESGCGAQGGTEPGAPAAGGEIAIEADAKGKAHVEKVQPELQLDGEQGVLGRSIIVLDKASDQQPRLACGDVDTKSAPR